LTVAGKLDRALIGHDELGDPRLLALGRGTRLLHLEAITWAALHKTDGALPRAALPRITDEPDPAAGAAALVGAGVWAVTDAGWRILTWDQLSAADAERIRETSRRRQERYTERRRRHDKDDHSMCRAESCTALALRANGVSNGVGHGVSNGVGHGVSNGVGNDASSLLGSHLLDADRRREDENKSARATLTHRRAQPEPRPVTSLAAARADGAAYAEQLRDLQERKILGRAEPSSSSLGSRGRQQDEDGRRRGAASAEPPPVSEISRHD
jgi:hypothetical protein